LLASVAITDWQNSTDKSSCKTDDYYFQRRFGVEMGILLVHDLYFVSFKTSGGSLTRAQRLAVRAAANQQLAFTAAATSFTTPNTAWFAKYGTTCLAPSVNGQSSGATVNFGMSTPYYFSARFDFSASSFSRACASTTARRTFGYQSLESEFFYRLCVSEGGASFVRDFANLFVTVTDITIVANYRNPVVTLSSLTIPLKFEESCGFLWNEMNWNVPSHVRFVSSIYPCEQDYPASYSTSSTKYTNRGQYTMYDGSLIKYFLDDVNYYSTVTFGGVPEYRSPYRMCMYVQSQLFESASSIHTAELYKWIDFPDVALYPVSENVKMSTKNIFYDSVANCPVGSLGCKCDATNTCNWRGGSYLASPAKYQNEFSTATTCNIQNGLCVNPSAVLFGALERTNAATFCSRTNPCRNPGPSAFQQLVSIHLSYQSSDLGLGDSIFFTDTTELCGSTLSSVEISMVSSGSLISFSTIALSTGKNYRLCVKRQEAGIYLDYSSTLFSMDAPGSSTRVPTQRTVKPTQWYNKGNTITYSPTVTNPNFYNSESGFPFGSVQPNNLATKTNVLFMTTDGVGDASGLYTQWTNFTAQDVKLADTLRVYRSVIGGLTAVDRKKPFGASQICSPNWVQSQSAEQHDLVMEVKVTKNSADVLNTSTSVAASVAFPALPKGYYTACFCRKTESGRCQMTPAGMMYSSAARMVSAAGSGGVLDSFDVTPLLDYEANSYNFSSNTVGTPFINEKDFCISKATDMCSACLFNEFTITLSSNSKFPLSISNAVLHGVGASAPRIYNLCFRDPLLKQYETTYDTTTPKLTATTQDTPLKNATWLKWNFAVIGTIYITDLTFRWEQNGGFTEARTSYSVASGTDSMVMFLYTGNDNVINNGNSFWFTNSKYSCAVEQSIFGASSSPISVPTNNSVVNHGFRTLVAGSFYRLCVRPTSTNFNYRDFGAAFGVWVTDVLPSATTFTFFNSFLVSLTSAKSLMKGDEFWLQHVNLFDCSNSGYKAGAVSPNSGVYNNSLVHNMGKMPQVTHNFDTTLPNIPLGYAGYRLCVKRTPSSGVAMFMDYAGVIFYPAGSNKVVWNNLPKVGRAAVRILSGLSRDVQGTAAYIARPSFTIQSGDVVWFSKMLSPCAYNTWSASQAQIVSSSVEGNSDASSRTTLTDSNFDKIFGQYVEFYPNFQLTTDSGVTAVTYRMCVQRSSWTMDGENFVPWVQSIVQDYPDIQVSVSSQYSSGSSSPTSVYSLSIKPTPVPATVPNPTDQVTTVYSSSSSNTITWTFTGTGGVDPILDKLAIVRFTFDAINCDGSSNFQNPISLIPAGQGTAVTSNGTATTAVFSSVASGKYFVCYCRASTSVTGACNSPLSWRQTVGYLYSIGVVPREYAISKLSTSYTDLTVWFTQQVSVDMRMSIVGASDRCGVSSPVATNYAPAMHYVRPTLQHESNDFSSLKTGLSISQMYSASTVGVYQICLCLVNCGGLASTFGGNVGTLLIHDIVINGASRAVTLQKTATVSIATLTITQTLFNTNDTVWFALNQCGMGGHVNQANLTAVTQMPTSGGSITVNYTLIQPSININQMCVRVSSSSKVYTFSTLGFIVSDVSLSVTSPATISNQAMVISYTSSLPSTSGRELLYFREFSLDCDVCDRFNSPCSVVADSFTSSGQTIAVSGLTTFFDFSKLNQNKLSMYRLCLLVDKNAAVRTFVDFNTILIYPTALDSEFFVQNGAVFTSDQYPVQFKVPSGLFLTFSDQLYFRRSDLACLKAAPTTPDNSTSSTFRFTSTFVSMTSNFSALTPTNSSLRLCVQTEKGLTLDYNTKTVYVTNVTVSTKICSPGNFACPVSLSVQAPEGFFTNLDVSGFITLWFERASSSQSCSQQPAQSETGRSNSRRYLAGAASLDFDFSNTVSSLVGPLRLCAHNSFLQRYADFSSVQLFVLKVQLTSKSANDGSGARTKYLASTDRLVHITADLASLPQNSVTWFQSTAQKCSKPNGPSASSTSTTTTSADLSFGATLSYDFSQVLPFGAEQIPLRLCYNVPDTSVSTVDANTVVVYVVQYTVTPAFVNQGSAQQVSVYPGSEVGISFFAFCRSDTVCPVVLQMPDVSTVNCSSRGVYVEKTPVLLDFANVQSNGMLLKLCASRPGYQTPFDVADLAPVGVYIGSASVNLTVADATSPSTVVTVTWSGVFAVNNNTYASTDVVWFQSFGAPCSVARQNDVTQSSNAVAIKASPFVVNFDFSKITGASSVRLCASVGGALKEFNAVTVNLMTVTLGASSVKPAVSQSFTVTYSSVAALAGNVSAFMSTDVSCKNNAVGVSTPVVASASGAVHTFDFSGAVASANSWMLCLQTKTSSLAVYFASVFVVDVGFLGATEVNNLAGQQLTISSVVSIVTNDTVWFSASGCAAAKQVPAVTFTGSNSYSFDFSAVTPSLTSVWSMCVGSVARGALSYTSSSVKVVPSANLGGPYMVGSRIISFNSATTTFLTGSQIAFSSSDCTGATYVASTSTTYNFSTVGTHSLCVKQTSGMVTKITSVSVVIQSCSDLCPASKAAGCDVVLGTCTNCTARFSGDRCQSCAAGYSGNNCDSCNVANNYQCSVQGSVAGVCASPNTCAICQCNGHYDTAASSRCPGNVCACAVGYSGAACESCQPGFFKAGTNMSSLFTCNSCADKCSKRASSCTADLCSCNGNFDPTNNCAFCVPGYVLNATSGSCVATVSPTHVPTRKPTRVPTRVPSLAPVDLCLTSKDVDTSGNCESWDQLGYCAANSDYYGFMNLNCAKTCLRCSGAVDSSAYAKSCPGWFAAGYCSSYAAFMAAQCAGSCDKGKGVTCGKDSSVYAGSCSGWKDAGYCSSGSSYYSFLSTNCAGTCCGVASTVNACSDIATYSASCGGWAGLGYCSGSTYSTFMTQNCRNSCGRCGDNSQYASSCAGWKTGGYCASTSTYYSFMQANCKTTCGTV